MTNLEREIGILFKLCSQANVALDSVAVNESQWYLHQVQKTSRNVFMLMENHVNSFSIKDFKSCITDRVMILKMLYIILYSVYYCNSNNMHMFDWDERCKGTSELAMSVFGDSGFATKIDKSPTWMRRKEIYVNALVDNVARVHKTLLQNMVRCLTYSLTLEEYVNKRTPEYLTQFESCVLYYLSDKAEQNGKRVYLDYI